MNPKDWPPAMTTPAKPASDTPRTAEVKHINILGKSIGGCGGGVDDTSRMTFWSEDNQCILDIQATSIPERLAGLREALEGFYAIVSKECPFCNLTTRYNGKPEITNHREECPANAARAILARTAQGKEQG